MSPEKNIDDTQPTPPDPFRPIGHYCPPVGTVADIIPFFWKGAYHVFYLHHGLGTGTPWDHIVSRDLIHWEELPRALPLGAAGEPDGGSVYTGSVLEHEGTFHIFYTGFNPEHPDGREHIMHATSPDLVAWTKQPGHTFKADGVHYRDMGGEDFRDPFVFWNEEEKAWWMLLCARDGRNGQPVTGLCTSGDLVHWRQRRPLTGNWSCPPECPDLFQTGGMWYLIASAQNWTTVHRFADDLHSQWFESEACALDTPILYAAKTLFDGHRRILLGWIRELKERRDDGIIGQNWGGAMGLPREVHVGRDGQLRTRPIDEAGQLFTKKVYDMKVDGKPEPVEGKWLYGLQGFSGMAKETPAHCRLATPDHYMLLGRFQMTPDGMLTLVFRQQEEPGKGYRLTLRPAIGEIEISGPGFSYPRRCLIDGEKPIKIQAFVQGTIIECFVNDAHAFSARAYDYPTGGLGLSMECGKVLITELGVSVTE